jgi:hypothetical protein
VSMSDEPKECNRLKLISIVRFACATLDVGHPILCFVVVIGADSVPKQSHPVDFWIFQIGH